MTPSPFIGRSASLSTTKITAAGSTFVGFWVPSLEATRAAVQQIGADVVLEHQDAEWGCRFVVTDPDGRAVEVNQRDHCPVAPRT